MRTRYLACVLAVVMAVGCKDTTAPSAASATGSAATGTATASGSASAGSGSSSGSAATVTEEEREIQELDKKIETITADTAEHEAARKRLREHVEAQANPCQTDACTRARLRARANAPDDPDDPPAKESSEQARERLEQLDKKQTQEGKQ